MAIEHIWEPMGVITKYTGVTTGDELIASTLELANNPLYDSSIYAIADWSKSSAADITTRDVDRLSDIIRVISKSNPDILNPSVLPKSEEGRALISLFVSNTDDTSWKTSWFETEEEAREWIASEIESRAIKR